MKKFLVLFFTCIFAPYLSGKAAADPILYATSTFTGEVFKIDASGNATLFASNLGQPHEIEIDGNGNLFVAEVAGDRITKISSNGAKRSTGRPRPAGGSMRPPIP